MRTLSALSVLLFAAEIHAATNTPLPAGTAVTVTTSAGTATGILQDMESPQWISVLDSGKSAPTLMRGSEIIVRQVSAGVPGSAVADGIPVTKRGPDFPADAFQPSRFRPIITREESLRRDRERGRPTGHYIQGRPRVSAPDRFQFTPNGSNAEVDGMTILTREAFTLGHYDKYRVPAWVAMRWTEADYDRSEQVDLERGNFVIDEDLPWYARGGTWLEYDRTGLQRGHMARDADLEAWGFDAVREGMRMSNIVPQQEHMNHEVWGDLEDEHRRIVTQPSSGVDAVWVISGPIFGEANEVEWVGNEGEELAVPEATYKVIAWLGDEDEIVMRGYIIGRYDTDRDLQHYLVPVQEIEDRTGLDFFSQLHDSVEENLERAHHSTLWEN